MTKPRDPRLRKFYEDRDRRINEPIPAEQKDTSLIDRFGGDEVFRRARELNEKDRKSKEG